MKDYRLGLLRDRRDKTFMRDNSQEGTLGRVILLDIAGMASYILLDIVVRGDICGYIEVIP
jgi:hypothetical protein